MPGDVNRQDAVVAIQEWRQRHHHDGSKPEDRSVTARLCDAILEVFHEAIRQLSQAQHAEIIHKPIRMSLGRARDLIALWSDGYGIQDGRLDEVLAKSRNLQRSTLKNLSSIANILLNRLIPLTQISSDKLDILTTQLAAANDEASYMIHDVIYEDDDTGTSSDGFSDAGPNDNIAEVAEDLNTDAQCLVELDPLFRNPVLDLSSHREKQAIQVIDWAPEKAYSDKVQQRFPRAESSLVERLGYANWARFLRCQEVRNSVETGIQLQANAIEKGDGGTVAASSKYHDSGLGTSLPVASSYAETVMTYGGGNGQKIRIPPLSDEARKGKPFPCLACMRLVRITNNSAWKKHLCHDLQPYLCLEPHCAQLSFSSRSDWVDHLALDHRYHPAWDAVTCPLCFETTEKGQLAVTAHLARHLEEISLSALPAYPDEDDDEAFETDLESASASTSKTPEDKESKPRGDDVEEDETIRCVCGFQDMPESCYELRGIKRLLDHANLQYEAGFFIQCGTCKSWQHGLCMGFRSHEETPHEYYCERCRPSWHLLKQAQNGNWYSNYLDLGINHGRPDTFDRLFSGSTKKIEDNEPASDADSAADQDQPDEEVLREWELRQLEDDAIEKELREPNPFEAALEEEDHRRLLDDEAQMEILERLHAQEQAHTEAYEDRQRENEDDYQDIAAEDHLRMLEAESEFVSSDEEDDSSNESWDGGFRVRDRWA